jgi:hypothetical protein
MGKCQKVMGKKLGRPDVVGGLDARQINLIYKIVEESTGAIII